MVPGNGQPLGPGSLLRVTFSDGTRVLRFISRTERTGRFRFGIPSWFETPLPQVPAFRQS